MGKRSSFERRERDFYATPPEPVRPLLPYLLPGTRFIEPCAGDNALVRHLTDAGHSCVEAMDIEPQKAGQYRGDATTARWHDLDAYDCFITNPPWSRDVLHPLIVNLSDQAPTWLLFDADWAHTRQAAPFQARLRKIVSVGRVKWIADSPFTGKDNCAWHLFGKPDSDAPCVFHMREAA